MQEAKHLLEEIKVAIHALDKARKSSRSSSVGCHGPRRFPRLPDTGSAG